jgi:hypothetical protein
LLLIFLPAAGGKDPAKSSFPQRLTGQPICHFVQPQNSPPKDTLIFFDIVSHLKLAKAKGQGKRPRQKAGKFCLSFLFPFHDDNNKMADKTKRPTTARRAKILNSSCPCWILIKAIWLILKKYGPRDGSILPTARPREESPPPEADLVAD